MWMWYSNIQQERTVSLSVGIDGSSSLVNSFGNSVGVSTSAAVEEKDVLLECVAKSDTKILFKYYISDRRGAMRQTVLSRDTGYFTYIIGSNVSNKKTSRKPFLLDETFTKIQASAVFFIGTDVLGYIRNYLKYKENLSNGLSSCYMYHGAVTLPLQLVYAAEIVCVLTGAKPLAMVRYSLPSLHLYFFPLSFPPHSSLFLLNSRGHSCYHIFTCIFSCFLIFSKFFSYYLIFSHTFHLSHILSFLSPPFILPFLLSHLSQLSPSSISPPLAPRPSPPSGAVQHTHGPSMEVPPSIRTIPQPRKNEAPSRPQIRRRIPYIQIQQR